MGICRRCMLISMFAPDRMVAHNLRPSCPGGTEFCGYMERKWKSTPMMLTKGGKEEKPKKPAVNPLALKTKVARPTKSRLRIPFL